MVWLIILTFIALLGFLLGFSGGSYYQYKRMAPYINQNWRLSTELYKMESMISVMDNLLVYEEKGVAEKWFYRLGQGGIECNYNPYVLPSSTTPPPSTVAPPAPSKPDNDEDYEGLFYVKEYPDGNGDTKKDTKDGEYIEGYSKNDPYY